MSGKVMSMQQAIGTFVKNGQKVYIGGFTHCVPFAAVHEIIRQDIRDLEVCKMVPELILDQLIAAGVCRKIIFGWAGNPGLGNLRLFRDACEKGEPYKIEIEEYSHQGLISRLYAGASGLPFMILKSNIGSDLPAHNSAIKTITCPYTGELLSTVPAYNADVAIFHAQKADANGNVQMWGVTGEHREAAFGAKKVIVTVEELAREDEIRANANLTVFPAAIVDSVVVEPWGAHPAYVLGYYDRDNDFYINWNEKTKDADYISAYLKDWVYSVHDRAEYVKKDKNLQRLTDGVKHGI
ncbi:3-oxoadipate--succinyl-CoA transferase subunit A [Synergistales bacterium]|nr:3-oxoadipate--succinyl-CoA transferase subunit A [Synergistales bacterium]